ncbi:MAG: hypothetical protein GXP48_10135 [Acidobacteria bacterium]|nr:hypothetical protein [Acidobacteriota bacterium]
MGKAQSGERTVSDGGRTVSAWWRWVGEDLVMVIGGGARPHVGSVVLAQPRPSSAKPGRRSATVSVLNIPPHKDEAVARSMAETLAVELGCTVVVTAGIHEDGLDAAGIESYLELAGRLARELMRAVRVR